MPKLAGDDDTGSDIDDVFEEAPTETIVSKAKKQVNGELKRKVNEDKDAPETSPLKDEAAKVTPAVTPDDDEDKDDEDKDDEGDEDDDEESEYIVELIREHKWVKGQLLYFIKWQGYPDDDNTWEPEDHLLPHSRQILAAYHKTIGGAPQAPMKRGKSNKSLREAASTEDLQPPKRRKRSDSNTPEEVGTWLPKGNHWEDQVNKVETIERDEHTDQLMAYIHFKNGKRSKITMDMVHQFCPRPMLRFYEEHLKFK